MTTPLLSGTLRLATAVFAPLILTTATPLRVQSQDSNRVSATMLRVLAEAADVHRTGQPVFLVADYRFPHNVIGHLPSLREAERLKADSGSTFGVFGPYVTPADPVADTGARIVGLKITVETPRGRVTRDLSPDIDALFLTMSAVDKFMIPYYAKIYGPRYAERLRAIVALPRIKPCHKLSAPCYPWPPGGLKIPVWDPGEPYRSEPFTRPGVAPAPTR